MRKRYLLGIFAMIRLMTALTVGLVLNQSSREIAKLVRPTSRLRPLMLNSVIRNLKKSRSPSIRDACLMYAAVKGTSEQHVFTDCS